jgi:hypothetical protein
MTEAMRPQQVFSLFAQNNADVVLIGGLAAVMLGVPVVTQYMDFCYNSDPANLTRLVRALAPLHPRLRAAGLTDEEARALPFLWDERTLRDSSILNLQTDAGPLDLMSTVLGVGSYADVRAAAVRVDLADSDVLVLDLPSLIASKRSAGRPKALLGLPHIEATLRLRNSKDR